MSNLDMAQLAGLAFLIGCFVGAMGVLGGWWLARWRSRRPVGQMVGVPLKELPAAPEADQATKGGVETLAVGNLKGKHFDSTSVEPVVEEPPLAEGEELIYGMPRFGKPEQMFYDPQDWETPLYCNGESCPAPKMTVGQIIWIIPIEEGGLKSLPWCLECVVDPPGVGPLEEAVRDSWFLPRAAAREEPAAEVLG